MHEADVRSSVRTCLASALPTLPVRLRSAAECCPAAESQTEPGVQPTPCNRDGQLRVHAVAHPQATLLQADLPFKLDIQSQSRDFQRHSCRQ